MAANFSQPPPFSSPTVEVWLLLEQMDAVVKFLDRDLAEDRRDDIVEIVGLLQWTAALAQFVRLRPIASDSKRWAFTVLKPFDLDALFTEISALVSERHLTPAVEGNA